MPQFSAEFWAGAFVAVVCYFSELGIEITEQFLRYGRLRSATESSAATTTVFLRQVSDAKLPGVSSR